jgi:hypothetical protein
LNFAAGFFGVPDLLYDYNQEIIIEADNFNNSLAPYETCNNSNLPVGNFGSNQTAKWVDIYLQDALKRLQKNVVGLNLTVADVFEMQDLCAYEVRFMRKMFSHIFTTVS